MTCSTKKRKYVCEGEGDRMNTFQSCQGNKAPLLLHWDPHKNIFLPPWRQGSWPAGEWRWELLCQEHTCAQEECPCRKLGSLAALPITAIPEMQILAYLWRQLDLFQQAGKITASSDSQFSDVPDKVFLVQLVPQRMNRNSFGTFLWPPNQKAWLCTADWNYHKKIKAVVLVQCQIAAQMKAAGKYSYPVSVRPGMASTALLRQIHSTQVFFRGRGILKRTAMLAIALLCNAEIKPQRSVLL